MVQTQQISLAEFCPSVGLHPALEGEAGLQVQERVVAAVVSRGQRPAAFPWIWICPGHRQITLLGGEAGMMNTIAGAWKDCLLLMA